VKPYLTLLEARFNTCWRLVIWIAIACDIRGSQASRIQPPLPGYAWTYAFAPPTMARRLVYCEVVRSDVARRTSDDLPLVVGFDRQL